jgi:hypothetical protein
VGLDERNKERTPRLHGPRAEEGVAFAEQGKNALMVDVSGLGVQEMMKRRRRGRGHQAQP